MDRRRALSQRPASVEVLLSEIQYWSQSANILSAFTTKYNNPATGDAIGRVNRLISAWPATNGEDSLPMDGFETVEATYKKLKAGLNEVKDSAAAEASAIEKALEPISVLIALRKAPEAPPQEKRNKRPRGSSPSSTPGTPSIQPINRVTLNVKSDRDRSSEGPANTPPPFKRDAKARAKYYAKQAPFTDGRKVAFQPPNSSGGGDDNTWILAVITRCLNSEKNKYEVQDAEPQDDGQPGQMYQATLKDFIPLPDPDAPPNGPAHPNGYPEFPTGSTVMALYPDTSCFYRAEVIQGPRDPQNARTVPSSKLSSVYRLRFEDDDDQVHSVAAQWVVEFPGP
ncbi:hypothetical protein BD410DRAFT_788950 [Rickenella mellea]|uniref:SGF29 C-terminal domain-containing protein n=1 Tax=Rickenella mellea TaxID=50990 RepID=A0A4Y7Q5M6_9AGAM|nr:hypothetical protein BD410DRAFT_788950 [Rickenella mellea]